MGAFLGQIIATPDRACAHIAAMPRSSAVTTSPVALHKGRACKKVAALLFHDDRHIGTFAGT